MPGIFTYPEAVQLLAIEPDLLPVLTMDDPIFTHFPLQNEDAHIIQWEIRDNLRGLQAVRGLEGQPTRVLNTGAKRYSYEPGAYGDFAPISERELTARRPYGMLGGTIDISDLIRERQDLLLNRQINRQRYILWTLLTTGTFSILNERGAVLHTDSFSPRTFTATVPWGTPGTATPLADFRAIQLFGRGTSAKFNAGATAYMNRVTFNQMIANTNATDLAGRRTTGLNALVALNIAEVNTILAGEDLPKIEVFDDGYYDENGSFQLFIPNSKAIVVGKRTSGTPLGAYKLTRNVNNVNMAPGSYIKIKDEQEQVPRTIEVHRGHNGGPVIYYPNGIAVMTV